MADQRARQRRPGTSAGPSQPVPAGRPEGETTKSTIARVAISILGMTVVALAARRFSQAQAGEDIVFTKQQLARHATGGGSLYLAILGEVFDVSSKRETYGPGSSYHHFVGVDGSRAFITGDFQGDLSDEVADFDAKQCLGLVEWLAFYHKTYQYVGKLEGAFYEADSRATQRLRWVEQQAELGRQQKQHEEQQSLAYPECNMQYTVAEGGFVWCDDDMYPRKLFLDMDGGQPTWRCACFKELGWSDLRQIYPDCEPGDKRCRVSPPGE